MTQIDHLVYATPDLNQGIQKIERLLGVQPVPGGRHPKWGTRNAILSLGHHIYLELLAPDPDQHEFEGQRLFDVDKLSKSRLLTWVAKSNDLEELVDRASKAGLDLGEVSEGSRKRPDGSVLTWRLTDPYKIAYDGILPFFIDWGKTPHPAESAPSGCVLESFYGEGPEPDCIQESLTALGIELETKQSARPGLVATIRASRGVVELR